MCSLLSPNSKLVINFHMNVALVGSRMSNKNKFPTLRYHPSAHSASMHDSQLICHWCQETKEFMLHWLVTFIHTTPPSLPSAPHVTDYHPLLNCKSISRQPVEIIMLIIQKFSNSVLNPWSEYDPPNNPNYLHPQIKQNKQLEAMFLSNHRPINTFQRNHISWIIFQKHSKISTNVSCGCLDTDYQVYNLNYCITRIC